MNSSPPIDLDALSPLAPALASAIASLAGDIALVIDRDGVIRSVAEGATPLSSASAGWVGRRWTETVTADTRPKIERLLDEVHASGVARRREVNHPASEGDAIPVAWSALRLGDSGAVIALGRDLRAMAAIQQRFLDTQQDLERAYWRRRRDESREHQLHQVAHDAVFALDAATLQLLEANQPALALLQQNRASAGGRVLTELIAPPARAAVHDLLAGARSSGRAAEIRLRLAEHEPPLALAATPFRGERQRLLLRARRDDGPEAPAPTPASADDAVLVVDSAARVLAANAAAQQHLQADTEAPLLGRSLAELAPANEAPLWQALVERARREGLVAHWPIGAGAAAIDAAATLLTEDEQERIGLVWRAARGPRPPAPASGDALRQLTAQLGQEPLPRLLARAQRDTERHLIAVALWRAGGSPETAAPLLGISVESLGKRIERLGLPLPGAVD